jgi:2-aminoadipate transaminase
MFQSGRRMQITQLDIASKMINFGIGQPAVSLIPLELIRRAADHRLSMDDGAILQYGIEQGNGYFRTALATFLSRMYATHVPADHLFVTAGASQALDLICAHFTRPGDTIFVEEPTYFLALRIFADRHLHIVSLPTDEKGLRLDALEEQLKRQTPAFLYTVPTYHNPSGVTLCTARRQQLAHLSRLKGFLVVADEVYHLLSYTAAPPPPMPVFDTEATILSLGSFSKILAPGLRLGWIQGQPYLLKKLITSGLLESGGGLNPFASSVVQSVLELGLQDAHLAHLKAVYADRAAALYTALKSHLPPAITFNEPEGGFFIWLRLPEEADSETLQAGARQQNIDFQPGIKFSGRRALKNYLRLSFAYYDSEVLKNGAKSLGQLLESDRNGS